MVRTGFGDLAACVQALRMWGPAPVMKDTQDTRAQVGESPKPSMLLSGWLHLCTGAQGYIVGLRQQGTRLLYPSLHRFLARFVPVTCASTRCCSTATSTVAGNTDIPKKMLPRILWRPIAARSARPNGENSVPGQRERLK